MHYAKNGIITPEMEFICNSCENMGRSQKFSKVYCKSEHQSGILKESQSSAMRHPRHQHPTELWGFNSGIYYS